MINHTEFINTYVIFYLSANKRIQPVSYTVTPYFSLINKLSRNWSFLRSEWVKGVNTNLQKNGYLSQIETKQQKSDFAEVI